MSREIQVRTSLQVRKVNGAVTLIDFRPQPTSFVADLTTTTPHQLGKSYLAALDGTSVDLTGITTPGFCRIQNQDPGLTPPDDSTYVEVGVYDPSTNLFYPMIELLPGESYVFRLSRFLGQDFTTGTGTLASASNKQLRLKSKNYAQYVLVEVLEK